MQAAGEPLKLKFAEGPYGPYAENLRHVLNAMEGHLISGYADGGEGQARTFDNLVNSTYAWNARKQQFSRRQLGIAVDVLSRKQWIAAL